MKLLDARLVASAAAAADLPAEPAPQLVLVGRSNVGKSSLINALVRRRLARTSAVPGKTRLVNVYRIEVEAGRRRTLHLVDLPGYGYARGADPREFERLVRDVFARATAPGRAAALGVVLLVDARHPALPQDLAAHEWLRAQGAAPLVVATKIDKLSRAERARSDRALRGRFKSPVLAVSSRTGEGLEELWKHISTLVNRRPGRPETG